VYPIPPLRHQAGRADFTLFIGGFGAPPGNDKNLLSQTYQEHTFVLGGCQDMILMSMLYLTIIGISIWFVACEKEIKSRSGEKREELTFVTTYQSSSVHRNAAHSSNSSQNTASHIPVIRHQTPRRGPLARTLSWAGPSGRTPTVQGVPGFGVSLVP
jgi:hypothetical protein